MYENSKVKIDLRNVKIIFNGPCSEVRDVCQAICCRKEWDIFLSNEEFHSGLYQANTVCAVTQKECKNELTSCINRKYRLQKKEDKSCIYLNDKNECSIHSNKPDVCRVFVCREWTLIPCDSANDKTKKGDIHNDDLWKRHFIDKLNDRLQFIMNPSRKLLTFFYSKQRKEVVFFEKMVSYCSPITSKAYFDYPVLDDESLFYLVKSFNGENTLGEIRKRVNEKYHLGITEREFYAIVWLLCKNNLIIPKK